MLRTFETTPVVRRKRPDESSAFATFDLLCRLQMKANRAEIQRMGREEQRKRVRRQVVSLWPIALGLLLGCLAPLLRGLVIHVQPWGMWLVFPLAAIAARPELHLAGSLARTLPVFALYAQFPIEGLLTRLFLRRGVTVPGVAREVFFFHFLGFAQLCLASGIFAQLFIR